MRVLIRAAKTPSPRTALRATIAMLRGTFAFAFLAWTASCGGAEPSDVVLADFSAMDPASVKVAGAKNAQSDKVSAGDASPSGRKSLRFGCTLQGQDASWAGISIPVAAGKLSAGIDTLAFEASAEARTRVVFVTLSEEDGARWTAANCVAEEWSSHTMPLHRCEFLSGPESRRKSRPRPDQIRSVDIWCGNTFQGRNGFRIAGLIAQDLAPTVKIAMTSAQTLVQQADSTITLEARNPDGSRASGFNGDIWLAQEDSLRALMPESARFADGRAAIPIFPRQAGDLTLWAWEPNGQVETSYALRVKPADVQVTFGVEPFQDEQVVLLGEIREPKLSLAGNAIPLSAHVTVKNRLGQKLVSAFYSVPELKSGAGRLCIPQAGYHTLDIRLLAEPLSRFHRAEDSLPIRFTKDIPTTVSARALPPGVTTTTIFNYLVTLEDLPSTATVIGRERFPVLATLTPPRESTFYKRWPFGIGGTSLFGMSTNEMETTGNRRLQWLRRLGAGWARDDVFWHKIELRPGQFVFQWMSAVLNQYKKNKMKLLGVLDYESAWSGGKAPADDEARGQWATWVAAMAQQFKDNYFYGLEVWNEPNTDRWKPAPDQDAYRKLVKVTHDATHSSGTEYVPGFAVAGATSGYDPVFLGSLFRDGGMNHFDALSFHPYPQDRAESPEANGFHEILGDARELLERNNATAKGIWLTEIGWPTGPRGVSRELQANYLVRAYTLALSQRIHRAFWCNIADREALPWQGEDWRAQTGLLDNMHHPKPAAAAYNLMAFMMGSMNPRGALRTSGKATICSFNLEAQSVKWPGILHVAWTRDQSDAEEVELPMIMNGDVVAMDYMGAERPGTLLREESFSDQFNVYAFPEPDRYALVNGDPPTTRTFRFRVNHEPLYIWDSSPAPNKLSP